MTNLVHNCNNSVTRVAGNLRDPSKRSRYILHQAKGITGIKSLRSDGSRDDQAGEAGLVEQSSAKAKSLKTEAEGLSGCHPSGKQPRQPDGGQRAK